MGTLDGKVAVITGGASGIGEATVRLFVNEGCRVVIADIQDAKGQHLAEELGPASVYVHTNVSQEADVAAAINQAHTVWGRLDCVFNNAGFPGASGPIESISAEGFDNTIGVLLRSVFLGIKYAAPLMKRQGGGSIINTASIAGLATGFGPHLYSMSKAAVIHLTRSVAMELGESGVRVNCICPGFISTPIFGKAFGFPTEVADQSTAFTDVALANSQPLQRTGRPEDIARAALWLASDDASFVNGHALVVDGGVSGGRMWSEWEHGSLQLASAMSSALGVPLA